MDSKRSKNEKAKEFNKELLNKVNIKMVNKNIRSQSQNHKFGLNNLNVFKSNI